jgi:hypothetical protein
MIQEHPPSMLRNVDGRPVGGAGAEDPGVPTIDANKHQQRAPGGAGADDPEAPTINAKKGQRWAPGRCQSWRSGSVHHQR